MDGPQQVEIALPVKGAPLFHQVGLTTDWVQRVSFSTLRLGKPTSTGHHVTVVCPDCSQPAKGKVLLCSGKRYFSSSHKYSCFETVGAVANWHIGCGGQFLNGGMFQSRYCNSCSYIIAKSAKTATSQAEYEDHVYYGSRASFDQAEAERMALDELDFDAHLFPPPEMKRSLEFKQELATSSAAHWTRYVEKTVLHSVLSSQTAVSFVNALMFNVETFNPPQPGNRRFDFFIERPPVPVAPRCKSSTLNPHAEVFVPRSKVTKRRKVKYDRLPKSKRGAGYCYLQLFRTRVRLGVAHVLGRSPTIDRVLDALTVYGAVSDLFCKMVVKRPGDVFARVIKTKKSGFWWSKWLAAARRESWLWRVGGDNHSEGEVADYQEELMTRILFVDKVDSGKLKPKQPEVRVGGERYCWTKLFWLGSMFSEVSRNGISATRLIEETMKKPFILKTDFKVYATFDGALCHICHVRMTSAAGVHSTPGATDDLPWLTLKEFLDKLRDPDWVGAPSGIASRGTYIAADSVLDDNAKSIIGSSNQQSYSSRVTSDLLAARALATKLTPFAIPEELGPFAMSMGLNFTSTTSSTHSHAVHASKRRHELFLDLPKHVRGPTTCHFMKPKHYDLFCEGMKRQGKDFETELINQIITVNDLSRYPLETCGPNPAAYTPGKYQSAIFHEVAQMYSPQEVWLTHMKNENLVDALWSGVIPMESAIPGCRSLNPDLFKYTVKAQKGKDPKRDRKPWITNNTLSYICERSTSLPYNQPESAVWWSRVNRIQGGPFDVFISIVDSTNPFHIFRTTTLPLRVENGRWFSHSGFLPMPRVTRNGPVANYPVPVEVYRGLLAYGESLKGHTPRDIRAKMRTYMTHYHEELLPLDVSNQLVTVVLHVLAVGDHDGSDGRFYFSALGALKYWTVGWVKKHTYGKIGRHYARRVARITADRNDFGYMPCVTLVLKELDDNCATFGFGALPGEADERGMFHRAWDVLFGSSSDKLADLHSFNWENTYKVSIKDVAKSRHHLASILKMQLKALRGDEDIDWVRGFSSEKMERFKARMIAQQESDDSSESEKSQTSTTMSIPSSESSVAIDNAVPLRKLPELAVRVVDVTSPRRQPRGPDNNPFRPRPLVPEKPPPEPDIKQPPPLSSKPTPPKAPPEPTLRVDPPGPVTGSSASLPMSRRPHPDPTMIPLPPSPTLRTKDRSEATFWYGVREPTHAELKLDNPSKRHERRGLLLEHWREATRLQQCSLHGKKAYEIEYRLGSHMVIILKHNKDGSLKTEKQLQFEQSIQEDAWKADDLKMENLREQRKLERRDAAILKEFDSPKTRLMLGNRPALKLLKRNPIVYNNNMVGNSVPGPDLQRSKPVVLRRAYNGFPLSYLHYPNILERRWSAKLNVKKIVMLNSHCIYQHCPEHTIDFVHHRCQQGHPWVGPEGGLCHACVPAGGCAKVVEESDMCHMAQTAFNVNSGSSFHSQLNQAFPFSIGVRYQDNFLGGITTAPLLHTRTKNDCLIQCLRKVHFDRYKHTPSADDLWSFLHQTCSVKAKAALAKKDTWLSLFHLELLALLMRLDVTLLTKHPGYPKKYGVQDGLPVEVSLRDGHFTAKLSWRPLPKSLTPMESSQTAATMWRTLQSKYMLESKPYVLRKDRIEPLVRAWRFGETGSWLRMDEFKKEEDFKALEEICIGGAGKRINLLVIMGDPGSGKSYRFIQTAREERFKKGITYNITSPLQALKQQTAIDIDAQKKLSDGKGLPSSFHSGLESRFAVSGEVTCIDEITRTPPGYAENVAAHDPNLKYLVVLGDVYQGVWAEPKDCSLNDTKNCMPEGEWWSNFCDVFYVGTRRLCKRLARPWNLPTTVVSEGAGYVHTRTRPAGVPILVISHTAKMLEYESGNPDAKTFLGSQGANENTVCIQITKSAIKNGDIRAWWTAVTRARNKIVLWWDVVQSDLPLMDSNPIVKALWFMKENSLNTCQTDFVMSRYMYTMGVGAVAYGKRELCAPISDFTNLNQIRTDIIPITIDGVVSSLAKLIIKSAPSGGAYTEFVYGEDNLAGKTYWTQVRDVPTQPVMEEPVTLPFSFARVHHSKVDYTLLRARHDLTRLREDRELYHRKLGLSRQFDDVPEVNRMLGKVQQRRKVLLKSGRSLADYDKYTRHVQETDPYETLHFPKHRRDDGVTRAAAMKKRVSFQTEAKNQADYNNATQFAGPVLWRALLELFPFLEKGLPWDEMLWQQCVLSFEANRLKTKGAQALKNATARAEPDLTTDYFDITIKNQTKTKAEAFNQDAKPGQTLVTASDEYLWRHGPAARYVHAQILRFKPDWLYLHGGQSPEDLDQWVRANWKDRVSASSDASSFDSSQDANFLFPEEKILQALSFPPEMIRHYHHHKISAKSNLRGGATLKTQRFTGEAWTYDFNTLGMLMIMQSKFDIRGVPCAASGDDFAINRILPERETWPLIEPHLKTVLKVQKARVVEFVSWLLSSSGIIKNPSVLAARIHHSAAVGTLSDTVLSYFYEHAYSERMGDEVKHFGLSHEQEEDLDYCATFFQSRAIVDELPTDLLIGEGPKALRVTKRRAAAEEKIKAVHRLAHYQIGSFLSAESQHIPLAPHEPWPDFGYQRPMVDSTWATIQESDETGVAELIGLNAANEIFNMPQHTGFDYETSS
jgi:hypothetical protein